MGFRHPQVDHYLAADVLWITSLQDGMNLTAKEFIAVQATVGRSGVLVLSRHTGAAEELGDAALLTDPHSPGDLTPPWRGHWTSRPESDANACKSFPAAWETTGHPIGRPRSSPPSEPRRRPVDAAPASGRAEKPDKIEPLLAESLERPQRPTPAPAVPARWAARGTSPLPPTASGISRSPTSRVRRWGRISTSSATPAAATSI
ncbi:trehalose-6-phosphate synthase [Actinacidiphila oryziradicis]|uniref:trehalose-6-phosphate synthase n=1 Tax=Actinacidiphila oryziradicis TaxID=2571141 RepID=UPI002AFF1D64|nr:trehalose-6-phosphate synthase [Actinacidiphila oryziradicis]